MCKPWVIGYPGPSCSKQKLLTFFSKNINVHAMFNERGFNDMLTNDFVGFEQLGPEC